MPGAPKSGGPATTMVAVPKHAAKSTTNWRKPVIIVALGVVVAVVVRS